jgi:hypothetical protein
MYSPMTHDKRIHALSRPGPETYVEMESRQLAVALWTASPGRKQRVADEIKSRFLEDNHDPSTLLEAVVGSSDYAWRKWRVLTEEFLEARISWEGEPWIQTVVEGISAAVYSHPDSDTAFLVRRFCAGVQNIITADEVLAALRVAAMDYSCADQLSYTLMMSTRIAAWLTNTQIQSWYASGGRGCDS